MEKINNVIFEKIYKLINQELDWSSEKSHINTTRNKHHYTSNTTTNPTAIQRITGNHISINFFKNTTKLTYNKIWIALCLVKKKKVILNLPSFPTHTHKVPVQIVSLIKSIKKRKINISITQSFSVSKGNISPAYFMRQS